MTTTVPKVLLVKSLRTYEIKQARWFKEWISNELINIDNFKALDCLLKTTSAFLIINK